MFVKLSPVNPALLVSLGLPGPLLPVRFVDPAGFERIFKDTPLEVILVNSRSGEAPDKPQAIAQASLAGGGGGGKRRANTPPPPPALSVNRDAPEKAREQHQQITDAHAR